MTAFSPGQSPPPVRTPTRIRMSVTSGPVPVVIAIDAGTTGVRAFAVDEAGRPAGWSYREFAQHFPRPGWVEHDADQIWEAVAIVLRELTAELDQPVAALGIPDQRETVVAWSK